MRPWRTTRHDSRIGRGGISLRATSIRGERLLEGRLKRSVTTQIPRRRLTRVGKGTTFSRTWKDEGRMTVSVTDRRRSNRVPWRRYANSGGTWLWIRCTSGNGCGLLIDRSQGRKGAKTAADLRHHNTRTAQSARMVALRRLHACGVGEHRSLLEPVYAILEGAFQIVVANEQSGSRICSATAYSAPARVQSGKNLRILNRHLQICVLESVRRFYISPREDGDGKRDHDDEGSAGQNYCIGMKRKSVLMVIQGLE
jgi:hypothetical protein